MKSILLTLVLALLLLMAINSFAQQKSPPLTSEQKQADKTINQDIIHPFLADAQNEPDWEALKEKVAGLYDAGAAERAVVRGKIFYFFNKDWKKFNANLVEYTEKYEDPANAKLMNKNAEMILQYSDDKTELEKALRWSKCAVDGESSSESYKKTYDELKEKLAR